MVWADAPGYSNFGLSGRGRGQAPPLHKNALNKPHPRQGAVPVPGMPRMEEIGLGEGAPSLSAFHPAEKKPGFGEDLRLESYPGRRLE